MRTLKLLLVVGIVAVLPTVYSRNSVVQPLKPVAKHRCESRTVPPGQPIFGCIWGSSGACQGFCYIDNTESYENGWCVADSSATCFTHLRRITVIGARAACKLKYVSGAQYCTCSSDWENYSHDAWIIRCGQG